MRNKNKNVGGGFTLIELLVVVAIIGLLASIAVIALMQARQKSRDAKRIGDMTQMNNALELYFATYKGYPSQTSGIPRMSTDVISTIPTAPIPPDGTCLNVYHSAACVADDPNCGSIPSNTYYYVPSGTAFQGITNGPIVYPDYNYYFCLGNQTGNFSAGERIMNPTGVR